MVRRGDRYERISWDEALDRVATELARIKEQYGPWQRWKPLLHFLVIEEKCKKCGLCPRVCPVDCIAWEKGQVAVIDREACTECTSCYDACRFMAIE